MKVYISSGLWFSLLTNPNRKKISPVLESYVQNQDKLYTSVYSVLNLFSKLPSETNTKNRTILHLIDEITEEILPLQRQSLEVLTLNESHFGFSETETEVSIAVLEGMGEILYWEEGELLLPKKENRLSARNLFREMN